MTAKMPMALAAARYTIYDTSIAGLRRIKPGKLRLKFKPQFRSFVFRQPIGHLRKDHLVQPQLLLVPSPEDLAVG